MPNIAPDLDPLLMKRIEAQRASIDDSEGDRTAAGAQAPAGGLAVVRAIGVVQMGRWAVERGP